MCKGRDKVILLCSRRGSPRVFQKEISRFPKHKLFHLLKAIKLDNWIFPQGPGTRKEAEKSEVRRQGTGLKVFFFFFFSFTRIDKEDEREEEENEQTLNISLKITVKVLSRKIQFVCFLRKTILLNDSLSENCAKIYYRTLNSIWKGWTEEEMEKVEVADWRWLQNFIIFLLLMRFSSFFFSSFSLWNRWTHAFVLRESLHSESQ